MAIYKAPVRDNFTIIPNETHQDTTLSLQARGLLGYFLSLPDDWVIRPEHAAKENGIGRNTVYKLIKELRESGYIIPVQNRSVKGKFSSGDYLVFRSKKDADEWLADPENKGIEPCVKKRYTVKGQLTKKELTKKQSKSVNNAPANNFSIDQIIVALHEMGMPQKETWYARKKAEEYADRFPQSQSVADACRYVTNAIDHAWKLEGKTVEALAEEAH